MNSAKTYHKILPEPIKPKDLPLDIKWLSGEGCGSWFHLTESKGNYLITRFSPEGKTECKGLFSLQEEQKFDSEKDFEITYLSHCSEVNVIQNKVNFKFKLVQKHDV